MHKNVGPFLAFNELFFKRHQRVLLFLLNGPIVKYWFRWILRIRKCDCSFNTRITEIGPNRFSFGDRYYKKSRKWFLHRTTDFRTHPKYGKRLYFAFWPVWWLLHGWDQLANVLRQPAWNFGFDTLTTYPDADPETTSVDGYIQRVNVDEAFSTIRDAASGNDVYDAAPTANCPRLVGHVSSSNHFSTLRRGVFLFDTSSLTGPAEISGGVLSLWGNSQSNGLGSNDLHLSSASPASNAVLTVEDYSAVGRSSFGSVAYASFAMGAYNNISLNISGLININKVGVSGFSSQFEWDLNTFSGLWASSAVTQYNVTFADQTGTSNDPRLVITYSVPTNLYYQTLSASSGNSVSLSRISTFLKTLSLNALGVGSVSRALSFYRNLSVAPSSSPVISRVRSAYRILSASVVHSQTLARVFTAYRTLSVTSTFPSSLSAVRGVVSKVLTASTSGIVTVTRTLNIYRTLTSSPYVLAQLTRAKGLYRTLTASFSSLPAITTAVTIIRYVTLPVSVATDVSLALLKTFYRALTASVSPSVALSQLANHYLTLSRIVSFSATQTRDKLIGRTLNATVLVSKSFAKALVLTKELSAASAASATITLLKTFYRTLSATASWITRLLGVGNKYSRQGTSYADKYSARGTSASDKYTTRNTNYEDKYH